MAMSATQCHANLKSVGVTDSQIKGLQEIEAAVGSLNWQALWDWVKTNGPAIIATILSIFGKSTA